LAQKNTFPSGDSNPGRDTSIPDLKSDIWKGT
jgi:hypothetical protein